jgi:hypothetical protein
MWGAAQTQPNLTMRNYDAWKTHDPDLEIEDLFCPDCESEAEFIDDADEDGPCGFLQCASCDARKKGTISLSLLENIELGGIDPKDRPDFVDAYVASADWINVPKGVDAKLTEEQLERLDSQEVAEYVQQKLNM